MPGNRDNATPAAVAMQGRRERRQQGTASHVRLLLWCAPAAPLAALALPFYMLVPAFYAGRPDLTLWGVGLVIVVVRAIDGVAEIWLGWASDIIGLRAGRRRGMVLVGSIPAALGAAMVFNPPATAGYGWLFGCSLVAALGYTVVSIAHTAWGAELAGDYDERTRFAAWREGATVVGLLFALVPGALTKNPETGAAIVGLVVLVALPLSAVCAFGTVPEPADRSVARVPFREGMRALWRNEALRRLLSAWFLSGFANAVPATLFIYFVSIHLAAPAAAGPLLLLYFCSTIVALPVVVNLSRRSGKHVVWRTTILLTCAVFPLAGLAGPGNLWLFVMICVATGFLLAFDLVLPAAIQADQVQADLHISGEQRAGLLFAILGATTKLALACASAGAFGVLGLSGFRTEGGGDNSSVLVWLYAVAPIVPKLAALVLMRKYPG